ncbi:MAG: hypothetical protein UHM56_00040, partial [Phascolarctobacterium sp.]|nr:hypothetical protein [Phascolarctobacterium sp.]
FLLYVVRQPALQQKGPAAPMAHRQAKSIIVYIFTTTHKKTARRACASKLTLRFLLFPELWRRGIKAPAAVLLF